MARFAIISEYNPLHAGHAYHLESARRAGADTVTCIMSGNFTQRGEPAIAHKYTRAYAALVTGSDLVVELPFPYAAGSAEIFAAAGVSLADTTGADTLFFGSECGDVEHLMAVASTVNSEEFKHNYQRLIKTNIGNSAAYAKAYEVTTGQPFPSLSNDLLGVAYCKAILRGEYELKPLCIKREGAAYRDTALTEGYPSATALRKLLKNKGIDALLPHMPVTVFEVLADAFDRGEMLDLGHAYDIALLCALRMQSKEQIEAAALCGGGLGARIWQAAREATNIATLMQACAHKSLPDSHVRRALLYAAIGVRESDLHAPPAYLSVLAANNRGRALLSELRRTCPISIITKPADAPECRQRALTDRADALYTLAMSAPRSAGFFTKHSPIVQD